jgi:hypothetical protein
MTTWERLKLLVGRFGEGQAERALELRSPLVGAGSWPASRRLHAWRGRCDAQAGRRLPRPGRDGNLPLVILEPVQDGLYQITEELSGEQASPEPDDDGVGVPDNNRQLVFLDSRTLFPAR